MAPRKSTAKTATGGNGRTAVTTEAEIPNALSRLVRDVVKRQNKNSATVSRARKNAGGVSGVRSNNGTGGGYPRKSAPRETLFTPTLMDYRLYVERCDRWNLSAVHESTIQSEMRRIDAELFDVDRVFDDRYVSILFETLNLPTSNTTGGNGARIANIVAKTSNALISQLGNNARAKKWRNVYANTVAGTSYCQNPPMLLRVHAGPETDDSTVERYRKRFGAPIARLDLGSILFARMRRNVTIRVDGGVGGSEKMESNSGAGGGGVQLRLNDDTSLRTADLATLGHRSLYWRRIYAIHTLLWSVVSNALHRTSVSPEVTIHVMLQGKLSFLQDVVTHPALLLRTEARAIIFHLD